MNNRLLILIALLLSCSTNKVDFEQPIFNFIKIDIIELSEIDSIINSQVIISIPNNKIIFSKDINGFKSNLSFNLIISDLNNSIILNQTWDEEIFEDFFEDTKSNNKLIVNRNIELLEGDYKLNLFINDYNNHTSWYKKMDFRLDKKFNIPEINIYKKQNNKYKHIMNDQILDLDTIWVNKSYGDNDSTFTINYKYFNKNLDTSELVFESNIDNNKNYKEFYPIEIINDFFNTLEINIIYNNDRKKKGY